MPAVLESCEAAAGLSLGEYTALVFAGALSFRDGLQLVQRRGEAMQAAADASRAAWSASWAGAATVEELCQAAAARRHHRRSRIFLCPGNIVVSGSIEAIMETRSWREAAGRQDGSPGGGRGVSHAADEAGR